MKTPLIVALGFWLVASVCAGPRDAEWLKVEAALRASLPKTAIETLEPIIAGALADRAYPEALKAIGRKIALEGTIQGSKAEEKIARLHVYLAQAPEEMKPLMEALLAQWYWHYFEQNRWRFLQRTATASAPGDDLQTWDLARILAEIDRHFTAALADERRLRAIPVADFDEVLPRGNVPDSYRPTLFDFIAYEALQFYQTGEHGSTRAENEFELDAAASPIFAEPAVFLAWQPPAEHEASPLFKAVRLLQQLMAFHRDDADPSAFLDADLARLKLGHNKAVGDDVVPGYKAALERFIAGAAHHESSARALAALATLWNEQGEPAKAHELAHRGAAAFPDQAGGAACFNLIRWIERKEATVTTERVWNDPWPTLDVAYRNVTTVHFRAVKVKFREYLAESRWNLGQIPKDPRLLLSAHAPALAWSADLPATPDFKLRTELLPVPRSLAAGFYLVFASCDQSFTGTESPVSLAEVWVSTLALVTQARQDGLSQGGFVLDARTGDPIEGARVQAWRRDREGYYRRSSSTRTDGNGRFTVDPGESDIVLLAEHRGQAVATTGGGFFRRALKEEKAGESTLFFTDRALYRPGQTIHYKGIAFHIDRDDGTYATRARRQVTVVFRDSNGKEIARAVHRTNDYGSFSGTFTAPRDRLLGHMNLRAFEHGGATTIRVEEYKLPKFRVEIGAPIEAAKLDGPVALTGTATAYTGAAIDGAKVSWRVERSVRLPLWCWWGNPPQTKAIAHGSATTEADGTFELRFDAVPERSVPVADEPVFVYTVFADVTDTNGETRSQQRTVSIGYTALQAELAAAEWQTPRTPVEFTVSTQTPDGAPQAAIGTLTVHALQQPASVPRAAQPAPGRAAATKTDPANPETWELGAVVAQREFATDPEGRGSVAFTLPAGIYRALLETRDRFGKRVTARHTVRVVAPDERRFRLKEATFLAAPKWTVEPGQTFSALWGTGYDAGRAFVEIECNGENLQSYWTSPDTTQERIEQEVTEAMRGGFTVRVTSVRENRVYVSERLVHVPWSNKQLTLSWERFRSKLLPGQPETWTAVLKGPGAKRAAGEMVAGLYDAALDHYHPHRWPQSFPGLRHERPHVRTGWANAARVFHRVWGEWPQGDRRTVTWTYRSFPSDFGPVRSGEWSHVIGESDGVITLSPFMVSTDRDVGYYATSTLAGSRVALEDSPLAFLEEQQKPSPPDLSKVAARRNLSETAFFFPHLLTDAQGQVRLSFTMPEALTEWRFFGFAHDKRLRAGTLQATAVTAKDLMVQPNPPRFVRMGDAIEFTVKVSNQSDETQAGTVRLTFSDAQTREPVDALLGNGKLDREFSIPAKQSRSYSWRIAVPDGLGFLTYKAVGTTPNLSDGEEGFLPVLSRQVLVTESLPLAMRGAGTREFEFSALTRSGASSTLRHQSLTVQMTSQPAWEAVRALPYLMEFPHECSEQLFNRIYANALARHIAASDPKIRRIFDAWKNTPALDSPLEKNADLKSVLLEETPWLRHASNESAARRNLGVLFDAERLAAEAARGLHALAERQLGEGLWPWFPGGPPSEYMSLYIATGFARLRHLGVNIDMSAALKSLPGLEAWMRQRYELIRDRDAYAPGPLDALYLYCRSFFLQDRPLAPPHREVVDYLLAQSKKFWSATGSRQSQAHLALALQRFGDRGTAREILASIKEHSVTDAEMGMFWRDQERSWWWHRAPIETQALTIEAFAEVTEDAEAVEACQVWLLKQKQTQDWKTTKATADAIYALLLRGRNLLGSDARVTVSVGGVPVVPERTEAGTGFYERKFSAAEVSPALGKIIVTKPDGGVSWGGVHWQYLENIDRLPAHAATPLSIRKTLFVRETSAKGQELRPLTGPAAVGDELIVRLELRTDRDMEYLHLKDQRGSGTEPVNVLSRYKYQDGLAYYESTRDTATHFFIDYLPKGTYVLEYSTRVQLRGLYRSGFAEIQCMYAPEFTSRSESIAVEVR